MQKIRNGEYINSRKGKVEFEKEERKTFVALNRLKVWEECEIGNHVKMGRGNLRWWWWNWRESFELCVYVYIVWFTWNDDGGKVISRGMNTWRNGIGRGSVWRSLSRASSHKTVSVNEQARGARGARESRYFLLYDIQNRVLPYLPLLFYLISVMPWF